MSARYNSLRAELREVHDMLATADTSAIEPVSNALEQVASVVAALVTDVERLIAAMHDKESTHGQES